VAHRKSTLSIFPDAIRAGRPEISSRKLFGGDSLFEILATLAANRAKKFTILPIGDEDVVALAETIGRTVTQTRREVRKLESIGVLEEVERRRKTEIYVVANNAVAERTLALPDGARAPVARQ
jgi:predicted transcriptional regulator